MKNPIFPLLALAPFALSAALGAAASASTLPAPPAPIAPAMAAVAAPESPPAPYAWPEDEMSKMREEEPQIDPIPPDVPPRIEAAAVPSFDADLPTEKSTQPLWKEWAHAAEFDLPRAPRACRAFRVREWVRIKCDLPRDEFVSTSLIAGNREGVSFGHNEFGQGYDVVFPVRSGDRRVFQIVRVASWSKYSVDHDVAFAISEAWPAGDRAPEITVD